MLQKFTNEWLKQITVGLQASLVVLWVTVGYQPQLFAQSEHYPEWWSDRGIVDDSDSAVVVDNFAAANIGQLKWLVTQAREELRSLLPRDEDGELLDDSWNLDVLEEDLTKVLNPFDAQFEDWSEGNHAALKLGQLKAAALPFYNLLNEIDSAWVRDQLEDNELTLDDGFTQVSTSPDSSHFSGGSVSYTHLTLPTILLV